MKPASPALPDSMVNRFRQRIFHPWSRAGDAPAPAIPAPRPEPKKKSALNFQARVAEFLLINRLRVRRRAAPSADVLEHAEHIVFVTCQNWFAPPERRKRRQQHTQL
jgi:hypothetical protein